MESTNANSESQQPAVLTAEQVLHQAIAHHKAGQLQDAEHLYRAILQAQPNHPDANHNLGVLAVQVKQVAAGLPYFKVALEANPNQEQYWLSYADALLATGQGADALNVIRNAIGRGHTTPAIQALQQKAEAATAGSHATGNPVKKVKTHASKRSSKQKLLPPAEKDKVLALFNAGRYAELTSRTRALVEQYPESGFVWKVLGVSLQMQGKNAVPALQKTVELLPDDANAYFNLGIALQALGQLDQAVASYQRALKIKSDYDEASNNLGNALKDLGRLDEAVASYRRTLEIRPNFVEARYNLGNALRDLGQLDDAVASYRRALGINPGYAEAHNNLGNALKDLRQFDDAVASYRRALEINPDYAEAHNNLGNVLEDLGQFDNAMASYRRALKIKPDFAEAHNNLGNALKDLRQFDDAVASYRQALEIKPDFAEAHSNLGNALTDLGRLDEAMVSYRRTLAIRPDYAEAHYNLGNALRDQGQLNDAMTSYRRALEINPDYAEAHSNLGKVLTDLGQFDNAMASYRRTLEIRPGFAEAHYNFGVALQDLGRFDEAGASYCHALKIKPDYVKAHNNLGNVLTGLGRFDEAVASLRRALEIEPDFAEAHNNLGNVLKDLGQLDDAMTSYRRALEIKPDFAEAHSNLGNVQKNLGQLDDAVISHRRALEIKPDYAEAYSNLGNALKDLGQLDGAVANYRRALEIKPDYAEAHSNLLFTHNYRSDQTTSDALADARHFGDRAAGPALPYADWCNIPEPSRCLRIGFVSADLRAHPVGYFLESILAALASHASTHLELVTYSNSFDTDAVTERIKVYCNGWHCVRGLSDEHLAKKIHDDGIDILIDLSGHTAHNRLTMFARKPAPIQTSWLGYFATTGVEAVDYLIADPWVVPKSEEAHFTEAIVRLPETYLCFTAPDLDVQVNALPTLETNAITFGCFNNLAKMNHAVVLLWAKILIAVPRSRLFLKTKQLNGETTRQSVMDRFAVHGIGPERLILEGGAPRAELLAAYQRIDIALDPFPYPGGTTSIEALWMGVPVLTLAGDRFLSHIGESILHNAGLPDWVALDTDDYVGRAVAHAQDLPRLSNLRERLRQQVLESPLFDAPRFARHLEAALRGMWVQWCNQQPQQKTCSKLDLLAMQVAADTFSAGRYAEAEVLARKLVTQPSTDSFGRKLLGTLYGRIGRHEDALESLRKAVALAPSDAEVHNSLGAVLLDIHQLDAALASCLRAIELKPEFAEAHNNLGIIFNELGQFDAALSSCHRALDLRSDFAEAHNTLGSVFNDLEKFEDAISSCRRALEIRSAFPQAHLNIGNALKGLGQFDEAIDSFRRAIEIDPNYAEAYSNLGNILKDQGQLDGAMANYRRALEIKPGFFEAHSNLLFAHNHQSDQTILEVLADARHFGDLLAKHVPPYADWHSVPEPSRRLRIGFVSADLRAHPVGYFLESILAALASHASTRLELIAYANNFQNDIVTKRLKVYCNNWHSVMGLSDEHLAKKIRDDGIDILIDLSGHTAHNRLPMFARKPAPIQVSWLGYFATTGVEAVDYLIADPWVVPKAEETHFTETIARLPETYLCFTAPDLEVHISALPALETNTVTFGCFNNLVKMNSAVVALWARVLMVVPNSRLFLKTKQLNGETTRQSVMDRFAVHGIGPERLILEGGAPRAELLAAYQRIDIALDPFPYPGGTTSIEALWMGVPVLTLAGDRFLSHIGESILHNAGLSDWIAIDTDDYVARAVTHAQDLPRLSNLRGQLRQQVLESPLFDAPRFAGHFEAALRCMWVQWCNQQPQKKL